MEKLLNFLKEIGLEPNDHYPHEGEYFLEWHFPIDGEKEGNGIIVRLITQNEKHSELMISFPLSWKKRAIFKELNYGAVN